MGSVIDARATEEARPLMRETELLGVEVPGRYRETIEAAWELSLRFVIDANGQSSLLGVPATVKSCSRGDSVIEGIAEEFGADALSAEGLGWDVMPFGTVRAEARICWLIRQAVMILSR